MIVVYQMEHFITAIEYMLTLWCPGQDVVRKETMDLARSVNTQTRRKACDMREGQVICCAKQNTLTHTQHQNIMFLFHFFVEDADDRSHNGVLWQYKQRDSKNRMGAKWKMEKSVWCCADQQTHNRRHTTEIQN